MKIRIKKDAEIIYLHSTHPSLVDYHWAEVLSSIEGKTIEVETKYLFKDQFNTVPISGVSEIGMRIMEKYVDEVIDDERPGKARCNWCGKVTTNIETCEHCNMSGYLEMF